MKNIFFFVFLSAPILSFGQFKFDSTSNKYQNSIIVSTPKQTKEALFKNAQLWATRYFKNYKDAVQVEDSLKGNLVYQYSTNVSLDSKTKAVFNIRIDCKNEKYRASVTDIVLSTYSSTGWKDSDYEFIERYTNQLKEKANNETDTAKRESQIEYVESNNLTLGLTRGATIETIESIKKSMSVNNDF